MTQARQIVVNTLNSIAQSCTQAQQTLSIAETLANDPKERQQRVGNLRTVHPLLDPNSIQTQNLTTQLSRHSDSESNQIVLSILNAFHNAPRRYAEGEVNAVRCTVKSINNDTNGNEHYQFQITFEGDDTVSATLYMMKSNTHDGVVVESSFLYQEQDILVLNGQIMDDDTVKLPFEVLEQVAESFMLGSGDVVFPPMPTDVELDRAKETLGRYRPLLEMAMNV